MGCKEAFAAGQGLGREIFRTRGVGAGGAFVARCVCVWATTRPSPTNVMRAFCFKKLFAGCYVFVAKAKFASLRALLMTHQPVCRGKSYKGSSKHLAVSS